MTEMITEISYEHPGDERINLTIRPCPSCHEPHKLTVNLYAFENWVDGLVPIEKAFPELLPSERELLLTGIDGKCFSEMKSESED